jgi:hypothetical protein
MSRGRITFFALLLLVVLPDAAQACAVCFDASDENRRAFLATTAFLSLLPLGMVGGVGLWIRKRSREMDARDLNAQGPEAAEPDAPEPENDGLGR